MSRLDARPADYAPGLELNLRNAPEGGKVRSPAAFKGATPLLPRSRCLVLVHGYNNHEGEAALAYLGFRRREYELYEDLLPGSLEARLGDAFWPGDADWPGPLDWLDFFFYPGAVPVARDAAPKPLANAVRAIPGIVVVDFVAHSLGCRLVLETINELRAHGGPAIGRVCLMAAAVPLEHVSAQGRFGQLLRDLQAAGVDIRVLHSSSDIVLGFTFVPGQAFAGEPTRGALGHDGPPPDMPGAGANVSERRIAGAGHSDYWGYKDSDASASASREAGLFLKLGARPRAIAPRTLAPPREVGWIRWTAEPALP